MLQQLPEPNKIFESSLISAIGHLIPFRRSISVVLINNWSAERKNYQLGDILVEMEILKSFNLNQSWFKTLNLLLWIDNQGMMKILCANAVILLRVWYVHLWCCYWAAMCCLEILSEIDPFDAIHCVLAVFLLTFGLKIYLYLSFSISSKAI